MLGMGIAPRQPSGSSPESSLKRCLIRRLWICMWMYTYLLTSIQPTNHAHQYRFQQCCECLRILKLTVLRCHQSGAVPSKAATVRLLRVSGKPHLIDKHETKSREVKHKRTCTQV